MTNFHTSWRDGMAFCAILDRHRPDLFSYDDCDPEKPLENLERAFSVAEKELGIFRIVDPEGREAISLSLSISHSYPSPLYACTLFVYKTCTYMYMYIHVHVHVMYPRYSLCMYMYMYVLYHPHA